MSAAACGANALAVPRFEPLTSVDDPRFEPYRDLRDRDARAPHQHGGHEGAFIAEGEVVLRVLAERAPARVRSVLLLEKRRATLEDALARLGPDVPVYLAPERVMSEVVGFPIHRGILALGARGPEVSAEALLAGLAAAPRSLVVGVCGVTNHDNVGGIFRNAAAFGASAVLLDGASCDPLYRKAIRVSVGAALAVPFARGGTEQALVTALEHAGYTVFALTPRGAEDVATLTSAPPRAALVLGAEGEGLAEGTIARARGLRIGMAPGWDSLNVAVASGVALHRLSHRALV